MSEAFQCNSVSDGGDGCRLDLALGKLNSCQVWFRMAGDEVREGGVHGCVLKTVSLSLISPNPPISSPASRRLPLLSSMTRA